MTETKSSFKKLPIQFEWAFFLLIMYVTYLFFICKGYVAVLCVITGFIFLNGWISSKATATLYSDLLLSIDVFALAFYFLMVLSLNSSREILNPNYWIYNAGLCACYLGWDIAILNLVGREAWKNRYRLYVYIMGISFLLFIGLYFLQINNLIEEKYIIVVGSLIWLILLGKWYWDKLKTIK